MAESSSSSSSLAQAVCSGAYDVVRKPPGPATGRMKPGSALFGASSPSRVTDCSGETPHGHGPAERSSPTPRGMLVGALARVAGGARRGSAMKLRRSRRLIGVTYATTASAVSSSGRRTSARSTSLTSASMEVPVTALDGQQVDTPGLASTVVNGSRVAVGDGRTDLLRRRRRSSSRLHQPAHRCPRTCHLRGRSARSKILAVAFGIIGSGMTKAPGTGVELPCTITGPVPGC